MFTEIFTSYRYSSQNIPRPIFCILQFNLLLVLSVSHDFQMLFLQVPPIDVFLVGRLSLFSSHLGSDFFSFSRARVGSAVYRSHNRSIRTEKCRPLCLWLTTDTLRECVLWKEYLEEILRERIMFQIPINTKLSILLNYTTKRYVVKSYTGVEESLLFLVLRWS